MANSTYIDKLTERANITFRVAVELAAAKRSPDITTYHFGFAFLCEDVKALTNNAFSPRDPSLFWLAIENENGDPTSIAAGLREQISSVRPTEDPQPSRQRSNTRQPTTSYQAAGSRQASSSRRPMEDDARSLSSAPLSEKQSEYPTRRFANALRLLVPGTKQKKKNPQSALPSPDPSSGDSYTGPVHVLLALLKDAEFSDFMGPYLLPDVLAVSVLGSKGDTKIKSKDTCLRLEQLSKFAIDLTEKAQAGELDPVIGRVLHSEMIPKFVESSVSCATKNSPALVEIARSEEAGEPIILFIDELHLIMAGKTQNESTGGMDAANLFKPALVWGKLRSMGATTLAEYREYIEKDGALERRSWSMNPLYVTPSAFCVALGRGMRPTTRLKYGMQHWLHPRTWLIAISPNDGVLPDSAIDLIDEACTSVRVTRDTLPEDIDLLERQKVRLQVDIQSLEEAKVDNDPGVLNQIQDVRNELTKVEYEIDGFNHYNKGRVERRNAMVKLRKQIAEARIEQRDFAKRGEVEENNTLGQKISEYSAELRELENQVHDPELSCITAEHIAAVVERITRIPLQRLIVTDKETCWVIGQPEAVHAVAQAIRRSRNGLNDETRPIALFLFTGISGTGKTHLSKMLAEIMFQTQDAMIRIDGSEYSEAHSPSRLIGSPPGYVGHDQGGHLTEYIRRHPYSIVLIDEIEEASEEFHTLFLQVLDDGRLTDGKGRVVDFR
ncbi:hypothetical protein FRB96_002471 [Tulasnella sp. 330]|nr:hypothetical protein FRB96_002471 [Tulasnella sp. 330]